METAALMRARNSDNEYKPLATHPSRVLRFVSLYHREFKPDRHTAFCVHALHCTQLVRRHTRVHKQDPTAIRSVRLAECVGWLCFVPGAIATESLTLNMCCLRWCLPHTRIVMLLNVSHTESDTTGARWPGLSLALSLSHSSTISRVHCLK